MKHGIITTATRITLPPIPLLPQTDSCYQLYHYTTIFKSTFTPSPQSSKLLFHYPAFSIFHHSCIHHSTTHFERSLPVHHHYYLAAKIATSAATLPPQAITTTIPQALITRIAPTSLFLSSLPLLLYCHLLTFSLFDSNLIPCTYNIH